jgi:predicted lipoprotein with Yx(FWY)xxD motif
MKWALLILVLLAVLAVSPPASGSETAGFTVTVRDSRYGRVLFDGRGQALYAFTRDRRGRPSTCYRACARAWPVLYAKGALRAGPGAKQSLLGRTRRRDGKLQVTYNGWPLYYYIGERGRPGVILCQNVEEFGGLWLVVRPVGRPVRPPQP